MLATGGEFTDIFSVLIGFVFFFPGGFEKDLLGMNPVFAWVLDEMG